MTIATVQIMFADDIDPTNLGQPLTPSQLLIAANRVGEETEGGPLKPGHASRCCLGETLAEHWDPAVAAWCPGCGSHIPAPVEAVAA